MKTNAPLIFAVGCLSLLIGTMGTAMAGKGKKATQDAEEGFIKGHTHSQGQAIKWPQKTLKQKDYDEFKYDKEKKVNYYDRSPFDMNLQEEEAYSYNKDLSAVIFNFSLKVKDSPKKRIFLIKEKKKFQSEAPSTLDSPKRQKIETRLTQVSEKPESFVIAKEISIPAPKLVHWDYKYDPDLKKCYMGKKVSEIEIPQSHYDPVIRISNGYMYNLEG